MAAIADMLKSSSSGKLLRMFAYSALKQRWRSTAAWETSPRAAFQLAGSRCPSLECPVTTSECLSFHRQAWHLVPRAPRTLASTSRSSAATFMEGMEGQATASLEGMAVLEVEAMAATDLTELAMEDMEQVTAVKDTEQAASEAAAAEAALLGHRQLGVGQATMIGVTGATNVSTVGSTSRARSSTRNRSRIRVPVHGGVRRSCLASDDAQLPHRPMR